MKAEQINKALAQKFFAEGERVVFWHDKDGEFVEHINEGLADDLAEVKVLQLSAVGGLPIKLKLEREDTVGKYLVYSQGETLRAEEDWLLDIRLYSSEFHADAASIWLEELGLNALSLHAHLKARSAFLASQERRKKLLQK